MAIFYILMKSTYRLLGMLTLCLSIMKIKSGYPVFFHALPVLTDQFGIHLSRMIKKLYHVKSIAEDYNHIIWCVTNDGVFQYDGNNWYNFSETHEELQNVKVTHILIDNNNIVWFAAVGAGLYSYDGKTIKTLDPNDNNLPDTAIQCINRDHDDVIWIAYGKPWDEDVSDGVYSYDGKIWTWYNTGNSRLAHRMVNDISIDPNNRKWFATDDGGISCFDGSDWITYCTENSGLISNKVETILADSNGNIWAGTKFGLSCFNGSAWKTYTMENSMLSHNHIYDIVEDHEGVIWIGTLNGLVQFNPDRSTQVLHTQSSPSSISIIGNYPNPFNPSTTIHFYVPESGVTDLVIHNVLGQRIRKLISESIPAGTHFIVWNGKDDNGIPVSSGIYIPLLKTGDATSTYKMIMYK